MALPLGWVLHDAAVYATSGRPAQVLELLPASAAIVVAGALLGWLGQRAVLAVAALVFSAALCAALHLGGLTESTAGTWFPRAVLLLVAAFAALRAAGAAGVPLPGRVRTGLLLGVLACVALVEWRGLPRGIEWPVLLGAAGVFLSGYLRSGTLRVSATAVVVLAVLLGSAGRVVPSALTSRADLPPPEAAPPTGPDLLLVVLDTVRADRLAPYGYERETTPALDRWVDEHFTRYASSRSTSSWTLPSHASLFTGLLPGQHGAVFAGKLGRPLPDGTPTLAGRLRDDGYWTAGIVSNTAYLRDYQYRMGRGFQHYDDRVAGTVRSYIPLAQLAGADPRPGHLGYRDARVITDLALEWLDRRDDGRPFFLFLNYMDAHEPNLPPRGLDRVFEDRRPPDRLRPPEDMRSLLYDRDLRYMDEHVDRLLQGLADRGRFDDTVIVVTSDHGESLGDHGIPGHGWVLYESVVHVPLYLKPAGGRAVDVVHDDITSADVFHVMLNLLGRGVLRAAGFPGLVAELYVHPSEQPRESVGSPEGAALLAWKDGAIKWIVSSAGQVEAYDLMVDPDELRPLQVPPGTAAEALRRAREWWLAHPAGDARTIEREERDAEHLKVLGYN